MDEAPRPDQGLCARRIRQANKLLIVQGKNQLSAARWQHVLASSLQLVTL
jgi:hypothetical protein